ncbi:hypothetical protein D8674_008144 [Pyrus ussuriensis x Pyrus communis]|uniref:Uncharacterized protein n=1 Tax=Pyrus ussuriensis x Pyrus communis TaxID=2448454 RepID=A0A5N5HRZ8_9ROSA|nr:hypothetical protein D8674_008144 [Pyrus ussuriensis x Pyrus communis]
MCYVYENPYENSLKFDHGGGSCGFYLDDRYGGYNRSQSDLGSNPYRKQYDASPDAGMAMVFLIIKESSESIQTLIAKKGKRKGDSRNLLSLLMTL